MTESTGPLDLAARVAAAFEQTGVRYVLGGSLASTASGEPRMTLDVDFAADLSVATADRWLGLLGDSFHFDRGWIHREVDRRGSFQVVHLDTMIRVDVFVPEWTGVHLWKWERRQRLQLAGDLGPSLDVTAPEGIVVQKLLWYQSSGEVSDRQWRDVVGVLKTQGGALNRDELSDWASNVGVSDLLERAKREAGL